MRAWVQPSFRVQGAAGFAVGCAPAPSPLMMRADRRVSPWRLMMVRAGMRADQRGLAGLGASVTDDLPADDGLDDLAAQEVTGERGVPTL